MIFKLAVLQPLHPTEGIGLAAVLDAGQSVMELLRPGTDAAVANLDQFVAIAERVDRQRPLLDFKSQVVER